MTIISSSLPPLFYLVTSKDYKKDDDGSNTKIFTDISSISSFLTKGLRGYIGFMHVAEYDDDKDKREFNYDEDEMNALNSVSVENLKKSHGVIHLEYGDYFAKSTLLTAEEFIERIQEKLDLFGDILH